MKRWLCVLFILIFIHETMYQVTGSGWANAAQIPIDTGRKVFHDPVLMGLQVDPGDPFKFHFIFVPGHSGPSEQSIRDTGVKLIKYFLTSLTLPEDDLWVNLSPTDKDRIIADDFGRTEMGRQLLEQDSLLKKLSASLTNPDTELGRKYWEDVDRSLVPGSWSLEKDNQAPGTNYHAPFLTKVWIMPDKAVIYQDAGTAVIGETHLKVMMEEEYEMTGSLVPGPWKTPARHQALITRNFLHRFLNL